MASSSSVTDALQTAQAQIEGQLPGWLKGTLMRTAPAIFELGPWRARHWFDGLGMMFSFTFDGTGVRFGQRLLDTETSRAARRGRLDLSSFGGPIQRGFFKRLFEPIPRTTDNANVNTVKLGDAWHVYTETQHQLVVDEDTLATRGKVNFTDELPPRLTMSPHPHWDFERKQAVNVGVTLGKEATVRVFDYAAGELKRRVFGKYAGPELAYMHSFGLTHAEAIIVAHPWLLSPRKLLWSNKGFRDHFEWKPERGSRLLVFDRSKTEAAPEIFETETLYVFHMPNAFRDGQDRVVDVLSYPDPGIMNVLDVESLQPALVPIRPALKRLRIKPGGKTSVETLLDNAFEVPAISYRARNGVRYQYVYGSTLAADGADLVKLDLESGERKTFGEKGWLFGEPVFVAKPGGDVEDEGVVLTVGSTASHSVLAVLDGKTFEPLARARLELPIPLGFHGSFAASANAARSALDAR